MVAAGIAEKRSINAQTSFSTGSPPRQIHNYNSQRRQSDGSSPPRTPRDQLDGRVRIKGTKVSRNRPSVRDAFGELPPQRERSNSHGLSWSPKNARNSVVDNMLLSLDAFESDTEPSASRNTSYHTATTEVIGYDSAGRQRGNTVSSASSSEYGEVYNTPPGQSRHRNSGSANFQSSLGRIDSVRVVNNQEEKDKKTIQHSKAKGKAARRDSSISSLGREPIQPDSRQNRRSQSFDLGHTKMASNVGAQDPFTYDGTDSAQAPSISVGPKTPASMLQPGTMSATTSSNHRRRDSTRSPVRENIQPTPSNQIATTDGTPTKTLPSPGFNTISHSKENQKPGFFRKLFGSSTGAGDGASQQKKQNQKPPSSMRHIPQDDQSDQNQLQKTVMQSKTNQPPLNKKPSFFRRRRKSIQDAPVPQLPEMYQDGTDDNEKPSPDSPGSLQKVMDQFYETHRRMDSKGSITTSKRKNSNSNVFATIRAVGTPSAANNSAPTSQVTSPTSLARRSSEDIWKAIANDQHRLDDMNGTKVESNEKAKSPAVDRSKQSPTHARSQSDIDKDLPRLPVNYAALKSDTPKEIPTSKYNPSSKPASRGSMNSQNNSSSAGTHIVQMTDNAAAVAAIRQDQGSRAEEARSAGLSSQARATPSEDHTDDNDDLADETKEALMFVHDLDEPTHEQKAFAKKLYDGTSGIDRAEVAPWLGDADEDRTKIRQAYMELFHWQDMSILGALRSFCSHLQLKGETQQVDRLLDALSRRWTECNPDHGFKATDVVHTICYSILLLNTDLHMADIESKMTRNQFIKNTMPTIRRVVADAAPHAFDNPRASMLPPRRATEPVVGSASLTPEPTNESEGRPTHRLQHHPSDHSGHDTVGDFDDCGPLVKSPFHGKIGGWEGQIEVVLKNFYISIRNQRLPLSGEEEKRIDPYQSSLSLGPTAGGFLRRTNSMLSKAGSETLPIRGRMTDSRLGSRWPSKGRSRARLYPASLAQSRTSIDDDQSAISPSMSSMWSKPSLGRTTMSVTSFASGFPSAEYQRSIGFANALSQAITRSDSADESTEDFMREGPLLDDESLELEGAPWAKEGILKHKHHLESVDKKAKDRNWNECFAVIEKGWIRLFQFNMNAKSIRQRSQKMMGGGVVGGGNWMENAQSLGQFLLRHTIASALPPPGYSKARPHVWALSLPTGAVHLFQAGTPEIVKEFVSTANYWSARLSKEPLMGGVSNIEYGWSERVINLSIVDASRSPSVTPSSRPSMSQSIRTSFDQSSSRPKLPGDKATLSDWVPPTQSMMASQLLEVDQLRALQTYISNIKEELGKHNELRGPMLLAFTPRQNNHAKAMNNWERKSSYLLREIVKFSTYLESLQFAQKEMERVQAEKRAREIERESAIEDDEPGLEMSQNRQEVAA